LEQGKRNGDLMNKNKAEAECGCHDHDESECDCNCGCGDMGFQRRFMTHKEELEMLEDYRGVLKLELEAVEERIAELKTKKK
jgi:hypothetical protein